MSITHINKRIDLIKMLPAGSLVAEIGVWRGYFSIEILNECQVGKLFLVDAWQKFPGYFDAINEQDQEENLRLTRHHIRGHLPGGRVEIVRGFSLDVAANDKTIPPLDAVYIDADHCKSAAYNDLVAWSKRLKPGGLIMGHDYCRFDLGNGHRIEVIDAVEDFCRDFGWEITHLTDEESPSYVLQKTGQHIPKLIHQIWVGDLIPLNQALATHSVIRRNPEFDYQLWTRDTLPAIGIDPDAIINQYGHAVYVSDIARLKILQKFGGIYLDCDCVCHKSLEPLCRHEAFTALVDRKEDGTLRYCTAVWGTIPNHPAINWQVERIDEYVKRGMPWSVDLASAAPLDRVTILPTHWIYPWLWYDAPEKRHPHPESFIEHVWSGSWAKKS